MADRIYNFSVSVKVSDDEDNTSDIDFHEVESKVFDALEYERQSGTLSVGDSSTDWIAVKFQYTQLVD